MDVHWRMHATAAACDLHDHGYTISPLSSIAACFDVEAAAERVVAAVEGMRSETAGATMWEEDGNAELNT